MNTTTPESGLVQQALTRLFGAKAARLSERLAPSHWLSYVLILSQSAAVLLVFGHQELPLLSDPSWAIRIIAGMGLFILLATVLAADMAMLRTLQRMPALARNRQRWAWREHALYVAFVLVTEGVTLFVVLSTLDADPAALVSARPLIAPTSAAFGLAIFLRVALVSWTAVQLVVIRSRLPVLLSTLTATGRELVGAHVERKLATLNLDSIHLPAAFRVYATMSRPPRSIPTWLNGWRIRRELAAEAEEARQVEAVVSALEDLELRQRDELLPLLPALEAGSLPDDRPPEPPEPPPPPSGGLPDVPPDAGVSESLAGLTHYTPSLRMLRGRTAVNQARARKVSRAEALWTQARALLDAHPEMSRADLREKLRCRRETANALWARWQAESRRRAAR
jgi:hypothetical protein